MSDLLFPVAEYSWLYGGFVAFVVLMLALDLGVFHRKVHVIRFREAAIWSAFWISLSLVINFILYRYSVLKFGAEVGERVGLEFLTGFLIEKALAVDNIFVFVLVFSALRIPAVYQHRVLFFGILGAIVFRGIFIALGAQLMEYHWVVILFGAFLILTGIKMLFTKAHAPDPVYSWQMRLIHKFLRISPELEGKHFWVRKNGVLYGTPLLAALLLVEISDIIFALDSVPAIFAITPEPLIVFMSNILAILGLRSLYFMLAGVIDRFIYLKYGLSLVLVFVGLKMVWLNSLFDGKFPISWSLGIIAALIGGSVAASLISVSRTARKGVRK